MTRSSESRDIAGIGETTRVLTADQRGSTRMIADQKRQVLPLINTDRNRLIDHSSQHLPLRSVPNRTNNHSLTTHTIENNIRSAADNQFADSGLSPGASQARMVSESLNHGNDSRGQPLGCVWFIQRHVSPNFLKPRERQRRPDDFYRHGGPSSCLWPQTHLGSGSSWSVPQERSHAFMSSCRM